MPTIEDMIIEGVKKYPSIYSSHLPDKHNNRQHFAEIAKQICHNKINAGVVEVLWDHILIEYIRNVNLMEEEYSDQDDKKEDQFKVNADRMTQLDFLRPHLYNPVHQISTTFVDGASWGSDSAADVEGDFDMLPGGLENATWPDELSQEDQLDLSDEYSSGFEFYKEDETSITSGIDEQISRCLEQMLVNQSGVNSGVEFYQQQFQIMFGKIEEDEKPKCYVEVVEALDQILKERK